MKNSSHCLLLLLMFATQGALARTIVVHSTVDHGQGSLRQALADASNGDTINLTANGTITLTSGELVVNKSLAIRGPGPHGIISGNGASRVFHITPGIIVTLSSLTIMNGAASQDIYDFPANVGGGIYSDHARLTVSDCTLSGNSASLGGAIFSSSMDGGTAALTVNNTTINNNAAGYAGGGIFSGGGFLDGAPAGSATVVVSNSAITNNSAVNYGGGILSDGLAGNAALTLNTSVLDGNSAGFGGGLYNNGDSGVSTATLTNSTLSNNTASFDPQNPVPGGIGSAIYNDGSASLSPGNARLVIEHNNVSNNSAYFEGTIYNAGGTMTLRNSTVTNNRGSIENRGLTATITNCTISGNVGGGIINDGGSATATVTLLNSAVTNNMGGGITNHGSLAAFIVKNSTISRNSASLGGGIEIEFGNVTLTDTTVSENSAGDGGGIAVYSGGTVTMNTSTISNNSAGYGGGIFNQTNSNVTGGTVSLTNCTVSGNTSTGNAPAIVNQSERGSAVVILNNDTFSGNVGGIDGIFNWSIDPTQGNATLDIANTILNTQTPTLSIANLDGTVTSHGYNISNDAGYPAGLLNGPGDILNRNPMLGPLQNNGGPTKTHALLAHSPAINAGNPHFNPYLFSPPVFYDQRGPCFPRVVNGRIDIGAFEATH
jgi:hypothetical protein